MTSDAKRVAAYLRRLATLIEGADEPVECHIVDDRETIVDEAGRAVFVGAGGTAVAILVGEGRDRLVRRISSELTR